MNLQGFERVHESNLAPGRVYFLKTRFGTGYVLASESTLDGWNVEVQPDSTFGSPDPKKRYKAGQNMLVPNNTGTFYEVKG